MPKWFFRPASIFVISFLALGLSLFVYIRSYLQVNEAFQKFLVTHNFDPTKFAQPQTWVTILILSLLVAVILMGLLLIFVTYQRSNELYRLQQNFINGFTHELKTPIASLKLYLDTFKKHQLPAEQQTQYLDYMIEDTKRLSTNVQQILSLGRLEERKYKANFEMINVTEFISGFVSEIEHRFDKAKISLLYDKQQGPLQAEVDIELFRMLVVNLIVNGIEHNRSDEPQIQISVGPNGASQKEFFISVSDNGIGVSKKYHKKIFKKFFQVGYSVKGSGIGLYLASIIVKHHKGKISLFDLREENDKGNMVTKFEVVLPLKQEIN